jgi:nitroreductase
MNDSALSAIFARRSIRKFQDRPIEKGKVKLLLQAAMAAPTAMNNQPWEFVVVDAPRRLKLLKAGLTFAHHNAPLGVVVCGSSKVARRALLAQRFWVQDCTAALENLLIAAVGLGLGTVWCGIHPIFVYEWHVRLVLRLPKDVKPLGLVLVGYPAEKKEPGTKYEQKRVHWQKY